MQRKTILPLTGLLTLFVVLGVALRNPSCSASESTTPIQPPQNPLPLERVSGVNLFHLEPNDEFDAYLANPDLVSNFVALQWNTFRLPIEWDDYIEQGILDPRKVARARLGIQALISRLKEVHQQTGKPLFLILDFHQYKFGQVCGGVGVPRGAIPEEGLSASDSNCLFKAYDRFWQNQNRVQDRWNEWALSLLEGVAPLLAQNSAWLSLGIEPMNEPQFGLPNGLFAGGNPVAALLGLKRWAESGAPQRQVDLNLIPFYQRFVGALRAKPFGAALLEGAFFIAEPFVFDHLRLSLGMAPLLFDIRIDGRYTGMGALTSTSRWIAAPHHYLGALDPGLLDVLPSLLRDILARYPNSIFTSERVAERIHWAADRMSEAGMASFFGEWGTQSTLLNSDGTPGGHEVWIRESSATIEAVSLGGLWWQYRTDPSQSQSGFYLLQGIHGDGTRVEPGSQLFKCGLVRLIFGRCSAP